MPIHLLSDDTISRIAAGEVIERPLNAAKELIENSIDAKATAITCEIRDGGISFLRVTDNGCGISRGEINNAFLRHATSKIESEADLHSIHSLGFRGEALASIAAVSEVEMITRTEDELVGSRAVNGPGGGASFTITDAGAPKGTTVIIRGLFSNVPVRRKFLRTPQTEGSYITDLIQQFALSHPDISFHYRINGQEKLHTTGNGSLKEVIYRIYGKQVTDQLVEVNETQDDETGSRMQLAGYISLPQLNRAARNQEIFFVNGRILKNDLLSRALEEGYGTDLMQHRFPFAVLHFEMDPSLLDINVHPSKMEIRFQEPERVFSFIRQAAANTLAPKEKIHTASAYTLREEKTILRQEENERAALFEEEGHYEPFETGRTAADHVIKEPAAGYNIAAAKDTAAQSEFFLHETAAHAEFFPAAQAEAEQEAPRQSSPAQAVSPQAVSVQAVPVQAELEIFTEENAPSFRIVGQVFSTYWIIEHGSRMLMVDQHAAHEKVQYERIMKRVTADLENQLPSQLLAPPIVLHLSGRQEAAYLQYRDYFEKLGFELENFGENAYAMRAVPAELYSSEPDRMLLDTLDDILSEKLEGTPQTILSKVASMSCKAAVKGGRAISFPEAKELIAELLKLDNPYHCPHGRPTMIVFSENELERKFKRIV